MYDNYVCDWIDFKEIEWTSCPIILGDKVEKKHNENHLMNENDSWISYICDTDIKSFYKFNKSSQILGILALFLIVD